MPPPPFLLQMLRPAPENVALASEMMSDADQFATRRGNAFQLVGDWSMSSTHSNMIKHVRLHSIYQYQLQQ